MSKKIALDFVLGCEFYYLHSNKSLKNKLDLLNNIRRIEIFLIYILRTKDIDEKQIGFAKKF
ncbi:MAG: hypothetical protein A2086_16505 [Spirochaetes bacterium GWD1_27_9]|nr:MAG: hypothetical protein A2Z98_01380 [Spirochaetes bacterium GWB1_27_13]OHD28307.1 MAG: hypothetical protein A2Y34_09845 [Spirochaetes bacterium GWC1_27_15]OHD29196.1 MAG: hypothetical protein A2086_16505 [Spirochaetes bacterium GWD1_27_9]